MKYTKLWILTPEQAEKFFEESLMKEAIKQEEKEKILDDMVKSDETIHSGVYKGEPDEIIKELSKHTKILRIKKEKKQ